MDIQFEKISQILFWDAAIVGGLVTIWKTVKEWRNSIDQRRADLRWREAEMAKRLLDDLNADVLAQAAMKMLDWDGRSYTFDGKKTAPISAEKRLAAMRAQNTNFRTDEEAEFIRDSFDALLNHFERIEHFIKIGLIRFEDVRDSLSYEIRKLAQTNEKYVIEEYIKTYNFSLAKSFLERYEENVVGNKR